MKGEECIVFESPIKLRKGCVWTPINHYWFNIYCNIWAISTNHSPQHHGHHHALNQCMPPIVQSHSCCFYVVVVFKFFTIASIQYWEDIIKYCACNLRWNFVPTQVLLGAQQYFRIFLLVCTPCVWQQLQMQRRHKYFGGCMSQPCLPSAAQT